MSHGAGGQRKSMGWKDLFSPVVTAAAERKEGTETRGTLRQIGAGVQLAQHWQQSSRRV